jgi:alkaline phosphatase D
MPPPIKIAFVSCAYASYRPVQPAWAQIREAQPDLLLMLGDNAYMNWYQTVWDFDALEACYRAQFEVPEFRTLIAQVPTLAVWDDHDCGPNDTLGAMAEPANLARTRAMFDRWMGFALNAGRPEMHAAYDALPGVRVLMLDVRSHRTTSTADGATVLGAAQEAWLWRQLDAAQTPPREITIVASGSGFSKGAEGHRVQDYTRFAGELRRELAFRAGGGADPGRRALFLAGDVHYNAFESHPEGFHEALSSGVACFQPKTYDYADFTPARHSDNWGLLTIDDDAVTVRFFANAITPRNPRPRRIDRRSWEAKVL